MHRMPKFILLFTLTVFATPLVAQQDLKLPKTDASLATTPDVQTAKWAAQWWLVRHHEKLEAKSAMKHVDLLMVGDSITHGWENGGKKVWDKFYANRNALNIGFSGDRTEQVLWRFDHGEIDDIKPKLAVIMIGTNNTGHRMDPPAEIAAGVKLIIGSIHQRSPETRILLLGIFPRGAKSEDAQRKNNEAANALIAKFAEDDKVEFLDISDKFLEDDGTLPKSVMPDLLHPNQKGYEIWAEAMEPSIKKHLGEK